MVNRSAADQANRDNWARQYKRLGKDVRRAMATAKYGKPADPNTRESMPFGNTDRLRRTRMTTQALRSSIAETGFALAANRSPFGRKALTKDERASMSRDIVAGARSLRGRLAVSAYGQRMGGSSSRIRARRAARA
jgi:hypothetical protein